MVLSLSLSGFGAAARALIVISGQLSALPSLRKAENLSGIARSVGEDSPPKALNLSASAQEPLSLSQRDKDGKDMAPLLIQTNSLSGALREQVPQRFPVGSPFFGSAENDYSTEQFLSKEITSMTSLKKLSGGEL